MEGCWLGVFIGGAGSIIFVGRRGFEHMNNLVEREAFVDSLRAKVPLPPKFFSHKLSLLPCLLGEKVFFWPWIFLSDVLPFQSKGRWPFWPMDVGG